MTTADAFAVINRLNSFAPAVTPANGEGEGEAPLAVTTSASASTATANSSAGTIIPPVLLASPDVVIEVRDRTPQSALLAIQPAQTSQDLALAAVAADSVADKEPASWVKQKPADSTFDEESWDDLLGELAREHGNQH